MREVVNQSLLLQEQLLLINSAVKVIHRGMDTVTALFTLLLQNFEKFLRLKLFHLMTVTPPKCPIHSK